MSQAIEDINRNEEHRSLLHLADAQANFLRRYSRYIPNQRPDFARDYFEQELMYLIHLAYREAQVPLTKQITDLLMMQNRPIFLENPK